MPLHQNISVLQNRNIEKDFARQFTAYNSFERPGEFFY